MIFSINWVSGRIIEKFGCRLIFVSLPANNKLSKSLSKTYESNQSHKQFPKTFAFKSH